MNRPKIICHILQSVDGNIGGSFFSQPETMPALQEFARIREEYACDAIISGAATAVEIYANNTADVLPEVNETYPRNDWQAAKVDKYAVIIDGQGMICWQNGMVERRGTKMHVITVLQENVCDAYIAHLRHADVSYVFAGKGSLDLPLAVQKLKEKFGIEKMLLSGGGIVDWAFLQAGLIDEISLVIPPVIDGGTGLASAFDDSAFAVNHRPKSLELIDVQRLVGDCIWLRYGYDACRASVMESMRKLKTDYIDLMLLHQPFSDYYGAWHALEDLYEEGKLRAIGVSNFYPDRLVDICSFARIKPMVNQVETHPLNQQIEAKQWMDKYGVQIEAWAPFCEGRGGLFQNKVLAGIGAKYSKSTAQVMLRWHIQRGVVVIPKSTHYERMVENFNVFDFTLTDEDMAAISALDKKQSSFFSHYDPNMVEWFAKMVEERKHQHDSSKEKKNW